MLSYSKLFFAKALSYGLCFPLRAHSISFRRFHSHVPLVALQNDPCYTESRNEIRIERPRMCFAVAGTEPEEKEQEEEGREVRGERGREKMREPKRAEERKSIPIQSESDKPEQCIVQTHSITQSHTHVEALTQTRTHTLTFAGMCLRVSIKRHYKPHKALQPLKSNDITTLDCLENSLTWAESSHYDDLIGSWRLGCSLSTVRCS